MKTSIGKNTLGGGKKMEIEMRNYNRSTHDLSQITRTSMAVGTLVPTFKQLMLPGDTFPIETRCHILTHPTIGALFGSFKMQNDFFFCPFRLYNAMLHNNTLGVGLEMSKVKFPKQTFHISNGAGISSLEGSGGTLVKHVEPSSLVSYLGTKRFDRREGEDALINSTYLCGYFDIFKNYYANKQEDYFYTIGAKGIFGYTTTVNNTAQFYEALLVEDSAGSDTYILSKTNPNNNKGQLKYITDVNKNYKYAFLFQTQGDDYDNIELSYDLRITKGKTGTGTVEIVGIYKESDTLENLIKDGKLIELTIDGIGQDIAAFSPNIEVITGANFEYITKYEETFIQYEDSRYNKYELSQIDEMRENILKTWNVPFNTNTTPFINDIFTNTGIGTNARPACSYPMVGLALKTYQSDINTNWIKTEWIDGDNGINAVTAIDTSSGSFTIDTLNLAKKVYDMLNRIAISDGTYNAWIQTIYTSGGLNHLETPLYIGGSSLEIEFQEVISNSASEEQPLGTLAGRGIATNHKGEKIRFKADEPGFIMCISSITPRVDYFQGNDWDTYLETMDDLHKPQLDGIGFQDRLYRNVNANAKASDLNKSIGKQPAWIEYMTNTNKTFGNFALIENEGWMCLNRIFGDIDTYTTYVQPHLYNSIFAETNISAQNFWVQILFKTTPRRVMSAKQMPNF